MNRYESVFLKYHHGIFDTHKDDWYQVGIVSKFRCVQKTKRLNNKFKNELISGIVETLKNE